MSKQKSDIEKQINTLTSERDYGNGEIVVKVDSESNTTSQFELSYIVGNAGWLPSYDVRAKNVNEPVEVVYKANIRQDTKIDWNNVKLNLSSTDPNLSGVAPELQTYFLNYNSRPPTYSQLSSNEVSGTVLDEENLPLPGANVIVKGTTIGTQADFDGRYSITVPDFKSPLVFSFIGYETVEMPIYSNSLNVTMEESSAMLEEVVVVGYGSNDSDISSTLSGKVAGVNANSEKKPTVPFEKVAKQLSVDFRVDIPYTIKSSNQSKTVDIASHLLPADYTYYSIPKIDKDAFLVAGITDWEQYSFLEGEANIFFEDTFIGKTILDVRYATDTLNISLGRDKNVMVNRKRISDFTTRQFIGNKKVEEIGWDITVKNNKSEPIKLLVFDQVPVSTLEEIEVKVLEKSGSSYNSDTGELKWRFNLQPNESKNVKLNYSVKYPKYRSLVIE